MELVEFLLARIAEDEAVARAAGDVAAAPWRWEHLPPPLDYGLVGVHPIHDDATVVVIPSRSGDMWPDRDTATHIARHDPARVLAECEAKRRIVEHAEVVSDMDNRIESEWGTRGSVPFDEDEGVRLLRLLALPYADHPAYRPEWRP